MGDRTGEKKVRPENLAHTAATTTGKEPPVTPVSQLANSGISAYKKVAEEPAASFADEPGVQIPIEQPHPSETNGFVTVHMVNNSIVKPNTLHRDVHGGRVFLIKL